MNESQAKSAIRKAGGSWDVFIEWMSGQTMRLNEDGTSDYYDRDVERYIRYGCNPANEPIIDYD